MIYSLPREFGSALVAYEGPIGGNLNVSWEAVAYFSISRRQTTSSATD